MGEGKGSRVYSVPREEERRISSKPYSCIVRGGSKQHYCVESLCLLVESNPPCPPILRRLGVYIYFATDKKPPRAEPGKSYEPVISCQFGVFPVPCCDLRRTPSYCVLFSYSLFESTVQIYEVLTAHSIFIDK